MLPCCLPQPVFQAGDGALLDRVAKCGQELAGQCAHDGFIPRRHDPDGEQARAGRLGSTVQFCCCCAAVVCPLHSLFWLTHDFPAGLPGVLMCAGGLQHAQGHQGRRDDKDVGLGRAGRVRGVLCTDRPGWQQTACAVCGAVLQHLFCICSPLHYGVKVRHACRHSCSCWCQPRCHPAVPMCSHASAAYGRGTAEACRPSCMLWMQQTMKQSR